MEIAVMIICFLVSIAINFIFVATACALAIKNANKALVSIIDECEKADKDEMFVSVWKRHNR